MVFKISNLVWALMPIDWEAENVESLGIYPWLYALLDSDNVSVFSVLASLLWPFYVLPTYGAGPEFISYIADYQTFILLFAVGGALDPSNLFAKTMFF